MKVFPWTRDRITHEQGPSCQHIQIHKIEEMLPVKIGDNLSLPEKIILTGEIDCYEMVYCCKRGGMRFWVRGESRLSRR